MQRILEVFLDKVALNRVNSLIYDTYIHAERMDEHIDIYLRREYV